MHNRAGRGQAGHASLLRPKDRFRRAVREKRDWQRLVHAFLVHASSRKEGSRSQNLIRAASTKSLLSPVTPSSGTTPAVSSKGLAALLGVLDLAMIEAIPKGMKVYDRSIGPMRYQILSP
jgi:hypothetical protein